jgi:hypothetical protein
MFFLEFFKAHNELKLFKRIQNMSNEKWVSDGPDTMAESLKKDVPCGTTGQLQQKLEAAGKVRVFAMVDVWTQSVLKPLHEILFAFLKSLPNDGTFDQESSVRRAYQKSKIANKSFGYDLSAATDRLPIKLQQDILSSLFGENFGKSWSCLLVGRPYLLNEGDSKKQS